MFDQYFNQSLTLLGKVSKLDGSDASRPSFMLSTRLGGAIRVYIGATTSFQPLMNLDWINRDRYREPEREEPEAVKKPRHL